MVWCWCGSEKNLPNFVGYLQIRTRNTIVRPCSKLQMLKKLYKKLNLNYYYCCSFPVLLPSRKFYFSFGSRNKSD